MKSDLEGVRPMENLVNLEKDMMEDREEAAVLTSLDPPLPSSPGDSVKTEGEQNPQDGIGLERVDVRDVPPTHVPETQALSQRPKRRDSGNPGGAPKRKRGNTPTPQEEPQERAMSLDRGEDTTRHRCHSVGVSSTVEPTGHPVGKESRRKLPYECEDCSKRFTYRSQLELHLRTHTGERPFQCLDCPKRFTRFSDLRVHQRIHTGEKPFCCTFCEKRFTHKSTLRDHQRVHTQEKPYQCAVCQKRFIQRTNLNKHMRTHSGPKPYLCPHCHLAFRHQGTFKRHQRTHGNEGSIQASDLHVHLRIHTGEKPFGCKVCKKRFTHESTLRGRSPLSTPLSRTGAQEDADALQSVHTMSALLHRWLRPDVLTKKQILDKLLLEKFMTCMPLELQVLVKERRVQSFEELKVLLRNKEKPRKWKVITLQEQKYLLENSYVQVADEEVGDTDYVLDLSMKSPSPISQTGVHPENSQEVNGQPGNQPGTSDVVWGQVSV
ncbi:zinc finger and SCAN domain-containing protein 5B-like [Myotis daubentonii]|uniref:zinc finger and SCAN domain-containing protein 5B-like n=1 Tax=Myotis daubentonii TaxID=98922 RepID=UPI002872DA19|nr:zinc finger and SCAN domain-containing protein 5B-like [Myotis daubentonii]